MREDVSLAFDVAERLLAMRREGEAEGFERGLAVGRAEGEARGYERGVAAAREAFDGALRAFAEAAGRVDGEGGVAAAAPGPGPAPDAPGGVASGTSEGAPAADAEEGDGAPTGGVGTEAAGLPLVGGSSGPTASSDAPAEASGRAPSGAPAAVAKAREPAAAPPFPGGRLGGMNRSEVRVFNVVSARPLGRMNVAFVAKEAEVKAGPAAEALRRFVAEGLIVKRGDYFLPADGCAGAVRLSTDFLRNSDELPAKSFQMRAMLYAVAVLGRANAGEVAAQAKIRPGSSDLSRGLTLLANQGRIVPGPDGYSLPEGLEAARDAADAGTGGGETFAMVKCGAVARGDADAIVAMALAAGLEAAEVARLRLPREVAEAIYEAHAGKGYHGRLIDSVCDGEVVIARLRGPDAPRTWRAALGATDPASAEPDTVRGRYGKGIPDNAAHGSDGPESAARELALVAPLFEAARGAA